VIFTSFQSVFISLASAQREKLQKIKTLKLIVHLLAQLLALVEHVSVFDGLLLKVLAELKVFICEFGMFKYLCVISI